VSALWARVRRIPSWQVTLGVALLVLGFLMAAQVRSLVPRAQYSSSELPPLRQTAQDLQASQDGLKQQIVDLRAQVQAAEQQGQGNSALVTALNEQLRQARIAAGLVELEGPGVVVSLRDSNQPLPPDAAPGDELVSAIDLRRVIAELWLAGAEAISVNGERIAVSTALTDIGSSVLVNSTYLQPPYEISAIGPPELYTRLTTAPGFLGFIEDRVQRVGLQLGLLRSDTVAVAAYTGTVNLVESRPIPSPLPSPGPSNAVLGPGSGGAP
jgi:uncharacterized protein YlxW (UPF0749 family)